MTIKQHFNLLLKFFSIGVIATLVHSVVYSIFISTNITSPQMANLYAYAFAITVSYFGQRYWTFSAYTQTRQLTTIIRFISASLLGYGLNAFWVYIVTVMLSLSAYYALLGIGFLTPLITFVLFKFWVFTRQ